LGKWNAIARRFPRLLGSPGEEGQNLSSDYQGKVNAKKVEIEAEPRSLDGDQFLWPDVTPGTTIGEMVGSELSDATTLAKLARLNADVEDILSRVTRSIAGQKGAASASRGYLLAREVKDTFEGWKSVINLTLAAMEQIMLERMEAEGLEQLRPVGGRPIFTNLEPYAAVEDKDKVREWALSDPDRVRSLSIHHGTLNSLTKAMLLAGEEPPPGVKVWCKTKIQRGAE
jgi:hypothetical protein